MVRRKIVMPELPEVETVKNILNPLVENKVVDDVEIYYDRLIQGNVEEFKNTIKGRKFLSVSRYGKFLFLNFDSNLTVISHLRMEGKYRYVETITESRYKHTELTFFFVDGTALSYDDTRKFGIMKLCKTDSLFSDPILKNLGVEANNVKPIDMENLYKKFNKNKLIKELLLDQSILCGIGNIYACEILFESKISPFTKGKDLTKENIDDIVRNSKIILDRAISLGGSTIHSFHPSEGVDGKFQLTLKCYGKEGQECQNCGTTIHKTFINGRGTCYCPNCQINKDLEKAIGITGPVGSGKSEVLKYFGKLGYKTVSSDVEIHQIYQDPTVKAKLSRILQTDFDIENPEKKKIITHILSTDLDKKRKLEAYVYPILEERLLNYIKENELIAIEVPLLFKAHFEYMFKKIFVIKIDETKQKENLIKRGVNPEKYLRLNKDYTYNKSNPKIEILENNGGLAEFLEKIARKIN